MVFSNKNFLLLYIIERETITQISPTVLIYYINILTLYIYASINFWYFSLYGAVQFLLFTFCFPENDQIRAVQTIINNWFCKRLLVNNIWYSPANTGKEGRWNFSSTVVSDIYFVSCKWYGCKLYLWRHEILS